MLEPVSLCIPVFRSSAFLPVLFERLGALKPAPSEILFLDDASPDNSAAMVRQFIETVAPATDVRLLTNTANTGIAGAYNRLAREARGEWVHILDADDYPLEPDFYARIARAVRPGCDVIVTALRSNSRVLNFGASSLGWMVPQEPPLWWPLLGSFATRSGVVYRRNQLLRQLFPDPAFPGSDVIHLLRLRRDRGCLYVGDAHVYYRVHASAASSGERSFDRYRTELQEFNAASRWAHRLDLAARMLGQRLVR